MFSGALVKCSSNMFPFASCELKALSSLHFRKLKKLKVFVLPHDLRSDIYDIILQEECFDLNLITSCIVLMMFNSTVFLH